MNSKRNLLFKKYLKNPLDLSLALEIKKIDDQIAEYTAKMSEDRLSERKSRLVTVDRSKH